MSQKRYIPKISTTAPPEGYAQMLAAGWDTLKETFNVSVPAATQEALEAAKDAAQDKESAPLMLGNERFNMRPRGTKSAIYLFENEDFRFFVRSPKMQWCLSVEYTSKGLWHHGIDALRERALSLVGTYFPPVLADGSTADARNWQRVSVAHWAYDFESPQFTAEMQTYEPMGRIVCPSRVKEHAAMSGFASVYGNGGKIETLTIGGKQTLQVQVYDKGREITQVSGKDWMIDLWKKSGFVGDSVRPKHVWRLEIRMGSEYLKNRSILTMQDLHDYLEALIGEAIFTRRLCAKSNDSNRWRWPLHPLWTMAFETLGEVDEILPLGKTITQSGRALKQCMVKNAAGTVRSALVLMHREKDMTEEQADALWLEIKETLFRDTEHILKTERAHERYKYVPAHQPPPFTLKTIPDYFGRVRAHI